MCRQLERLTEKLRNDVVTTLTGTYGIPETVIDDCFHDMGDPVAALRALAHEIADEPVFELLFRLQGS